MLRSLLSRGFRSIACSTVLLATMSATAHEVKDLKYGVILFEFHQKKYFEALVEYEYAAERGGIKEHGDYPELLKGGISLSYGLSHQAESIFDRLIAQNLPQSVQNRAWFYMAKMLYMKGDYVAADHAFNQVAGELDETTYDEYTYLNVLNALNVGKPDQALAVADAHTRVSDRDPSLQTFLLFNKGIAHHRLGDIEKAIQDLLAASLRDDDSREGSVLRDRANMAIAYLAAQQDNFPLASQHLAHVKTSGVYSNQALLSYAWLALNQKQYSQALPSLLELSNRSVAIPEVQEAQLLVPFVYERMALEGRAAQGFINAYGQYESTLEMIESARATLANDDLLELFVLNLDSLMEESDWFGTPPAVGVNPLSPFVLDMMSDHTLQSVLKDLRDLYAIRNNLKSWKHREQEFLVMLQARKQASENRVSLQQLEQRLDAAGSLHARMQKAALTMEPEEQKRMSWLLSETGDSLQNSADAIVALQSVSKVHFGAADYAERVYSIRTRLQSELDKTHGLIVKIQSVVRELVAAELDLHEQRIQYYMVQAQLAKTRILDKQLIDLDPALPLNEDQAEPVAKREHEEVGDDAS